MKTLISCAYTMDNCCVELKFRDGRMIAIDTIAVENEIADNMYQRSEFDGGAFAEIGGDPSGRGGNSRYTGFTAG